MTEIAHGTVIVQSGEAVLPRWWRTVDRVTIFCVLALFAIGILLGLAASTPLAQRNGLDPFHYMIRQLAFGGMALTAMILVSMIAPVTIRRLGVIGFFGAMLALAMLPAFGTDFGQGATRWYSLGFASVQPAEFLKPVFVIFTAWMIAASQEVAGPPGKSVSLFATCVIVGFLVTQPDFGQGALIIFAWSVIYFVAGAPMLMLFAVMGIVAVGGAIAYSNSEHVARRIDGFLSAEIDPTTQIGYATDAIRNGGLFGAGLGEGTVRWTLPDAHTDFIIAVAAEEYGVMLVFVIIALFATITIRAFLRLIRERDPFIRLAGTGLASLLALQAFINLGVAARLLPAKGMTLPFVSYGGSSLIATGIAVGMLLAFTRSRPQGEIGDILLSRHAGRGR
ncbi:peptidoglycan glycosyltransferase FtsW [Roseicyclus mahoneyensis]|uniref:Probable peptidoglycan glycosyltransferase FtsW n=1 Tax=Roseicyclus mahoneyensis TaxID=164332 RepID=A0A316GHH9_9RHOB|nr:putative peptidoglycan glycosyltransferase FtsW [Roseicyclus mahoneyensis]PWK60516.1 cell division protein FtsW [Roseicyclus mahoneyensis]